MKTAAVFGGIAASLLLLAAVFFVGLCCGYSLADDANVPSASPSSSASVSPASVSPVSYSASSAEDSSSNDETGAVIVNNGTIVEGSGGDMTVNGIQYKFPNGPSTIHIDGNLIEMADSRSTLSVSGDRLRVNGVKYGRVPPCGRVTVTARGDVLVNGVKRTALPQ